MIRISYPDMLETTDGERISARESADRARLFPTVLQKAARVVARGSLAKTPPSDSAAFNLNDEAVVRELVAGGKTELEDFVGIVRLHYGWTLTKKSAREFACHLALLSWPEPN